MRKLSMAKQGKRFLPVKIRYIISPLTSQPRSLSGKVLMKYVGPTVVYKYYWS